MIILIATITVILYIILISSTLHNLGSVADNKVKILYMVVLLVIILICTLITFYISATGVEYENTKMIGNIRNMILAVFVPVNGLIVMPYLANLLSKIGSNNITQEKFKKRLVILVITFFVILIFECSYFKSTQLGILKLINKN